MQHFGPLYSTVYRPIANNTILGAKKSHTCCCGRGGEGSATDSAEFSRTLLHGKVEEGRRSPGTEGRETYLAWPNPHKILD